MLLENSEWILSNFTEYMPWNGPTYRRSAFSHATTSSVRANKLFYFSIVRFAKSIDFDKLDGCAVAMSSSKFELPEVFGFCIKGNFKLVVLFSGQYVLP